MIDKDFYFPQSILNFSAVSNMNNNDFNSPELHQDQGGGAGHQENLVNQNTAYCPNLGYNDYHPQSEYPAFENSRNWYENQIFAYQSNFPSIPPNQSHSYYVNHPKLHPWMQISRTTRPKQADRYQHERSQGNLSTQNNIYFANDLREYAMSEPAEDVSRKLRECRSKRHRSTFNNEQILELETEFYANRYLNRTQRLQLARKLNMTERQVKIWFQNRRMKQKKENLKLNELKSQANTLKLDSTGSSTSSQSAAFNDLTSHGNVLNNTENINPLANPLLSLAEMIPAKTGSQPN